MKIKHKITLLFFLLLLVMGLTIASTYAWYSFSKETNPILVNTGSLKLDVALYCENQDNSNNDGVIEEITDWENLVTEYSIDNAIPGEVYSFKIVFENKGTIPGYLSLNLINIYLLYNNNVNDETEVLNSLEVRCLNSNLEVEKDYGVINENLYYRDPNTNINYYYNKLFKNYIIEPNTPTTFYFQIKINGDSTQNNTLMGYTVRIGNVYSILDQTPNQIND